MDIAHIDDIARQRILDQIVSAVRMHPDSPVAMATAAELMSSPEAYALVLQARHSTAASAVAEAKEIVRIGMPRTLVGGLNRSARNMIEALAIDAMRRVERSLVRLYATSKGQATESEIVRACDYLDMAPVGGHLGRPGPSDFDGAEVMSNPLHAFGDGDRLIPGDATPQDLWPLSTGAVVSSSDPWDEKIFSLTWVKSLPRQSAPKEVQPFNYRVSVSVAWVGRLGEWSSDKAFLGSRDGKIWGWRNRGGFHKTSDRFEHLIGAAIGHQFAARYEWSVVLGFGSAPRLRFATSPRGAQDVFRLRDVPNGASRRAALRHWVSEHWRKGRADAVEARMVRAHLRGALEFTWNDLRCKIIPSEFDQERAAEGRAP